MMKKKDNQTRKNIAITMNYRSTADTGRYMLEYLNGVIDSLAYERCTDKNGTTYTPMLETHVKYVSISPVTDKVYEVIVKMRGDVTVYGKVVKLDRSTNAFDSFEVLEISLPNWF